MGLQLGMLQHAASPRHKSQNQAVCVLGGDARAVHVQLVKGPQLSPKGSQEQTRCICIRVDTEMETGAACVQMNRGRERSVRLGGRGPPSQGITAAIP